MMEFVSIIPISGAVMINKVIVKHKDTANLHIMIAANTSKVDASNKNNK